MSENLNLGNRFIGSCSSHRLWIMEVVLLWVHNGDGDDDDDDDGDGDDDGCLRVVALAAKITARHSCSGGATNNPRGHSTRIKDKKEPRERKKTRALVRMGLWKNCHCSEERGSLVRH